MTQTSIMFEKPDNFLKVISNVNSPRHCPYCKSNKWNWIKTIPSSPETIGKSLLMLYECEKCGIQFIAAEKAQAKLVQSANRCAVCNSAHVEKISKTNADIELYFCKQCRCYMVISHN